MLNKNLKIRCNKCSNDTFIITESEKKELYVGCSNCGEGRIFGKGLSSADVLSILKGETNTVIYRIK